MEYAVVAAAARFRLTGSRAGAVAPVVAMYAVFAVAALGLAGVVGYVLGASRALLPLVAFGAGMVALAWRTAARWSHAPALVVGGGGLVVEHPDLAGPFVVAREDVSFVVWSEAPPSELLPGPRFPVVTPDGAVVGALYEATRVSSLTLLDTSPLHRPTVAVVFRGVRSVPVRTFSVLRGPLSRYPVDDSAGLLLPLPDVAAVRRALDAAGIPNGPALPATHAAGLRLR